MRRFNIKDLWRELIHNQVLWYALSRYMITGISFITSLIIAVKLGSYLLGIYGFFLLMRNYFKITNLGIPDSTTILMIQHINEVAEIGNYERNAVALTTFLSFVIVLFGIAHYFFRFNFIIKYEMTWDFYLLCAIAIFTLFNDLFFKIYRVEGRIVELIIYQSIIQLLCFFASLAFEGRTLINVLISCYLVGNIASVVIFICKGYLNLKGVVQLRYIKEISNKGLFLFLFNFLFYLIFMSTRTAVSAYYELAEFGMFTFAYTLSNGVILLIDAIAALLIPKLIDRFNTDNTTVINDTIHLLKINYTYAAYGLAWVLIIAFTILLFFLKNYYDAFDIVIYMSLTVVLQTHSFPFSTLLMAKNKEKQVANCAAISLAVNIALIFIIISVLKLPYQYVILATWISYFLYTFLCIYYCRKLLSDNRGFVSILKEAFPLGLLFPVLCGIIVAVLKIRSLVILPLVLYVLFNLNIFKTLLNSVILLIKSPKIIDIKK